MGFIKRLLDITEILKKKSCFLFGPRQTGKSAYIKEQLQLKNAVTYNLLNQSTFLKINEDPTRMRQELEANNFANKIVVIDEIQKCPALLDEVHLLIEEQKIHFLLTGSSARKLKNTGTNLLGGRAYSRQFHPFVYQELKNHKFKLERAMYHGLIPSHYLAKDPKEDLHAYVGLYLTQEIAAEGLTRNIPAFSRFLEIAATCNGQLINFANIGSDARVPRQTVQNYFEILKDTLIANELPAYTSTVKRKAIETAKFYFFDMGVVNSLRRLGKITKQSNDYGEFFEHFIYCELKAYIDYLNPTLPMSYWRSASGFEVDFILGDSVAIEVKSAEIISGKHLKGLIALSEENLMKKYIVVSHEKTKRKFKNITIYPWQDFLEDLWEEKIIKS